ncbi:MAG: D-alanyl-D-alanine carboxypeptidase family protein [Pseudomonadota bacterium]
MSRLSVLCTLAVVLVLNSFAKATKAEPVAHLVFDLETGQVIDDKDAFRPWYPASVTKLMTAYVTFRAIRSGRISLQSPVVVSANALAEPPSKMGFNVGTELTIDNALKMVLVKSANDISVALGEAVSGSENGFLADMNYHARKLGMSRTHFNNPHGLPDNGQVTTARDIALLSRALLQEFPEFRHYFKIAAIRHGKRRLKSANALLERYPGAMGLKTGYICNSGFNMVASAERSGRTMVAVVFGAASGMDRAVYAAGLLDRGFASFGVLPSSARISTMVPPTEPGTLPADGYCRRAVKPTAESLLLRHGSKTQGSAAYASLGRSTQDMLRAALDPKAKSKSKSKKKSRITRAQVLDILVGPRTAQEPVRVFVGAPAISVVTGRIPTPDAKPTRVAAIASQSVVRQIETGRVAEGGKPPEIDPIDLPGSGGPIEAAAAEIPWPKKVGEFYLPQPRPAR